MLGFLLLGILDVISALLMLFMHLGLYESWRIPLIAGMYLVIKGVVFRGSWLSYIDIFAGVYFILMIFGLKTFLIYAILLVMIYKLTISLLVRG